MTLKTTKSLLWHNAETPARIRDGALRDRRKIADARRAEPGVIFDAVGGGRRRKPAEPAGSLQDRVRGRYVSFRELLSLNNDCLELLASIQEDLQFAPRTRELLSDRVGCVFDKTAEVVRTLERLTGYDQSVASNSGGGAAPGSGDGTLRPMT